MPFFRPSLALALALACGVAAGCAKEKARDQVNAPAVPVPADEATPEERKQIERTLSEIETLAGELARPQAFRRLPVLVTTEDMQETKRAGACYMEGGKGKFILVNRMVLRQEEWLSQVGLQTTLFRVLLHEIGHCYLARDHLDDRVARVQGKKLRFAPNQRKHRHELEDFLVSSMESQSLLMPLPLKKYYVAELLGLFRARSLAELAEYTGAESIE